MDRFRGRIAGQLPSIPPVMVHNLKRVRLLPSETKVVLRSARISFPNITNASIELPLETSVLGIDLRLETLVLSIDLRPTVQISEFQVAETILPADIALTLTSADFDIPPASVDVIPLDEFPQVRVFGRNYADKYWKEYSPQDGTVIKPTPKRVRKTKSVSSLAQLSINPDDSTTQNRQQRAVSFWELIFVVLKPPIDLKLSQDHQLPHALYPYQVPGIKFLTDRKSALLADDMGTGKTVMTCVALKALMQRGDAHRALILCPPRGAFQVVAGQAA